MTDRCCRRDSPIVEESPRSRAKDPAGAPSGQVTGVRVSPGTKSVAGPWYSNPAAAKARGRFAFACLDWTEGRAHLGGALGAELASQLLNKEWLKAQRGTRALLPTSSGPTRATMFARRGRGELTFGPMKSHAERTFGNRSAAVSL